MTNEVQENLNTPERVPVLALADFVNESVSKWMIPRVFIRPNVPSSLLEKASAVSGADIGDGLIQVFVDDCPDRTGAAFLAICSDKIVAANQDGTINVANCESIKRIGSVSRRPTPDNPAVGTISVNDAVIFRSVHVRGDDLARMTRRADECLEAFGIRQEKSFMERLYKGGEKVVDFLSAGSDFLAPAGIAALEANIRLIEKGLDEKRFNAEQQQKARDSLRSGYNKLISSAKAKAHQAKHRIAFDEDRNSYEPHGYVPLDEDELQNLKRSIGEVDEVIALKDQKSKKYSF
jgi:hypothetical protein